VIGQKLSRPWHCREEHRGQRLIAQTANDAPPVLHPGSILGVEAATPDELRMWIEIRGWTRCTPQWQFHDFTDWCAAQAWLNSDGTGGQEPRNYNEE
jgi:hypothetical protein